MLRAASALLDAAGWTVGEGGLRRNAKGEVLKVEFIEDSPAFERIISPYVENLRALGVDAQLVMVDSAQLVQRVDPPSFDFDIIVGNAVNGGYEPGAELKQAWATVTKDNSSRNRMGFAHPAVDNLADWLLVSALQQGGTPAAEVLAEASEGGISVRIARADGQKCERCWHYETDIGQHSAHPSLCGRCVAVLE